MKRIITNLLLRFIITPVAVILKDQLQPEIDKYTKDAAERGIDIWMRSQEIRVRDQMERFDSTATDKIEDFEGRSTTAWRNKAGEAVEEWLGTDAGEQAIKDAIENIDLDDELAKHIGNLDLSEVFVNSGHLMNELARRVLEQMIHRMERHRDHERI